MDASTIATAASVSPGPPSASIATVFDIYFLQSRICSHLDSRSLRRCALVSRDFYVAFNPFLWRSIRIRTRLTYKRFIQPEAQAALARFASIVTEASSVFPSVWTLLLLHPCPNLVLLDSPSLQSHIQRYRNTKYILAVLQLLQNSQRLQTLRLGYFVYEPEAVARFFEAVRRHPTLKHLDIDHDDYVSCILVRTMLWSTLRLERFSFSATVMNYRERLSTEEEQQSLLRLTGQEDPIFALRELILPGRCYDHEQKTLFHFLKRCPNLERLTFPGIYWPEQLPTLVDIIGSTMPRLQHLDFRSLPVPGSSVAMVLKKCRNLRTFIGHDSHEGPMAVILAVSEHWRTLEVFQMYASGALPSSGILQLLTTCSKLEVLDLMRVESRWLSSQEYRRMTVSNRIRDRNRTGDAFLDVAGMGDTHNSSNAPWVCEKLKVLRINYGSTALDSRKDTVLPKMLYEQLSTLSRLEDLRLGWVEHPPTPQEDDGVDLVTSDLVALGKILALVDEQELQQLRVQNIGAALQAFTKLRRLRKLELRGLKSFIEKEQVRRVRSKWEDLEWIQYS